MLAACASHRRERPNCPVGATGSEQRLGSGVGILDRRLLNVCVKFSVDEVESGVRSTSADTLSDQPLSEWPAGREADWTLAQRTAAVGMTDRGSLSELALMADRPLRLADDSGLGSRRSEAKPHWNDSCQLSMPSGLPRAGAVPAGADRPVWLPHPPTLTIQQRSPRRGWRGPAPDRVRWGPPPGSTVGAPSGSGLAVPACLPGWSEPATSQGR
jgi:hypothetical protein